ERHRRQLDRRDHLALPDRLPALGPADEDGDSGGEPEEERDHPRDAQPARRHEPSPAGRGRRRRGVDVVVPGDRRHLPPFFTWRRYCTRASSWLFGSCANVEGITFFGYPGAT